MSKKIINIFKIVWAFLLMTIMAVVASLLRIFSFGWLTNFNRGYFIPNSCKFILWSIGIKIDNRIKIKQPATPQFFTFNHDSYLDGFVLMSLAFTNARFLLSEKMLWYIPVTITAFSIGLMYIPQKKHSKRRLQFFKNFEKRLKREKISFVGSSEGVHPYIEGICPFNRGVYHTAMLCKLPVFAIYIHTPSESNPLNNFRPFKRGTIVIELLDIIPTTDWKFEELDANIKNVRQKYVNKYNQLHNANTI